MWGADSSMLWAILRDPSHTAPFVTAPPRHRPVTPARSKFWTDPDRKRLRPGLLCGGSDDPAGPVLGAPDRPPPARRRELSHLDATANDISRHR